MQEGQWGDVIRVHQHVKKLMLVGEELDLEFDTYIQPIKELRDALEHIMRVLAVQQGISGKPDPSYVSANLQKALGHEYRAFFDVADWLSVEVRTRIRELVEPFSVACLTAVVPEYYRDYKPRIEGVSMEIAEIRDSKDIAEEGKILTEVEHYSKKLYEIIEISIALNKRVSALQDYAAKEQQQEKKERRSRWFSRFWEFVIGVVAGIAAGFLLARLLGIGSP